MVTLLVPNPSVEVVLSADVEATGEVIGFLVTVEFSFASLVLF
jgi:hypothetical protein